MEALEKARERPVSEERLASFVISAPTCCTVEGPATHHTMPFGAEFTFAAVFLMTVGAAALGQRNEVMDAWLLFKPNVGEGFEWELALCMTLLVTFFAQPFMPLEHRYSHRRYRFFFYAAVGLMLSLFVLFDTSIGLLDLLDDGNYTQYDVEERKENLLVTILNIVLIVSLTQIFALRTRWQYAYASRSLKTPSALAHASCASRPDRLLAAAATLSPAGSRIMRRI